MDFNYNVPPYELQLPNLDARDAALLTYGYLNSHNFNAHELEYFPSLAAQRFLVVNPNHQYLREFIENFLLPPLRDNLLNVTPDDRFRDCNNYLKRHNCNIENSCRRHLKLILKLQIIAATRISKNTIYNDFQHFVNYRYNWNLMRSYFKRFIEPYDLITFMLVVLPEDSIQYFIESAVLDFYQHILEWMDTVIHFLVNNLLSERIEFFIGYGAKNVDNQDVYEAYTTALMLPIGLPVNSRIKMRVIQIYAMSIHDNKNTLRMLMAANMEPFLTKQQFQAVCNEFLPHLSDDPDRQIGLLQSWNWYSTIFGIQDNAIMTPRPLRHICRYVIRCNMARQKQLPDRIPLDFPPFLKNYILLIDWDIPVSDEVLLPLI